MNIEDARDSRTMKFLMKRVGLDPAMLDEIKASQFDLLLTHHLLAALAPETHAELHAAADAATKPDGSPVRETVVAGRCIVYLAKMLYADRLGKPALDAAVSAFIAQQAVKA